MENYFTNFSKSDKFVFKFTLIAFLLFLFSLFFSCKTLEQKSSSETTTKESTEITKDTDVKTSVSEEIKDRVIVNVPQSNNQEVMAMFDIMMKQLNTSKTSGSNSYNSRYDENLKQWVIDFTVAQSKQKETNVVAETKTEKSFEENVNEYLKTKGIPFWVWLIVLFAFRNEIYFILSLFLPLKVISIFKGKNNNPRPPQS